MRRRLTVRVLSLLLLASLVLAPAAQAYNNGRGFYGETNDKAVTNAGFIVIIFFPVLVFVLSMLQIALDRRKEARKAARKALPGNGHWPGGW